MALLQDFNSCVTDGRTDGRTDGPTGGRTDRPSYRDSRTHLKTGSCSHGQHFKNGQDVTQRSFPRRYLLAFVFVEFVDASVDLRTVVARALRCADAANVLSLAFSGHIRRCRNLPKVNLLFIGRFCFVVERERHAEQLNIAETA